ncbi:hypothetical protein [Flavonifractor sp. An306]|uniref:hypothetical protein n=1 Tax=Flavonifractor sp. An306 TaxID=1965629 RepID=UPI001748143D|nr:hypothetical protein [Flavonifractor sp. An306]
MGQDKQILEDLQKLAGCDYLSDLRFCCSRESLLRAIKQLRPEDYVPAQWKEAVCYLLSSGV